ncbi:dirigent protein 21 [Citrus sinensis]|uniref:dirigent protein 21 n=2 Tax=Citrus TaxID=2706 RepID=UPI0022797890|nr:dirigent protein 21 [Citrus sinensis]XP_052296845.1 dirigent protein 21 [Citrus sinensis]XP_052296846.1 dirigent protein 21 [Citrus sinensis]XP_052296847.1 dirigent protein 21 [Citrus sinensis]XP_052296848.1 dirigent protein 21 [Citrus sinensis]XP_052296849.1 dirigent protein 21 [Citrus sinensis]XP_052296850.1 dirigent protein 21 [Citrus sinensis]XP_052296851.1 dirigent protein 21 [Citrus sinensis]XP_052296852.1 dirigent protein 21 [Citrus sinensis]XP_052296853.1 dirigent protein 21 [Ci
MCQHHVAELALNALGIRYSFQRSELVGQKQNKTVEEQVTFNRKCRIKRNHSSKIPSMALSLYIQQPQIVSSDTQSSVAQISGAGAFVFHHTLTEGPEITSRSVGKAQGFIVPIEQFAHSAFNIIYLTFETPDYSGSLSVQANDVAHKENEELTVVGGTGSFAFARGHAIFSNTQRQTYHVNLRLKFPNRSHSIPG